MIFNQSGHIPKRALQNEKDKHFGPRGAHEVHLLYHNNNEITYRYIYNNEMLHLLQKYM
jgi:hypothetical protein